MGSSWRRPQYSSIKFNFLWLHWKSYRQWDMKIILTVRSTNVVNFSDSLKLRLCWRFLIDHISDSKVPMKEFQPQFSPTRSFCLISMASAVPSSLITTYRCWDPFTLLNYVFISFLVDLSWDQELRCVDVSFLVPQSFWLEVFYFWHIKLSSTAIPSRVMARPQSLMGNSSFDLTIIIWVAIKIGYVHVMIAISCMIWDRQ